MCLRDAAQFPVAAEREKGVCREHRDAVARPLGPVFDGFV